MGQLYSVVVPVYNSAATLEKLHAEILDIFGNLQLDFELLLVNDSSKDDTWEVMTRLKANHINSRLVLINLARNHGQHTATLCGLHHAKGDFIITLDDDLQFSTADIELLINKQKETKAELVYAVPMAKKNSTLRRIGRNAAVGMFHLVLNTPKDGSSFRLIQRSLLQKILHLRPKKVFVDGLLNQHAPLTALVSVRHFPRRHGQSGYFLIKEAVWTIKMLYAYGISARSGQLDQGSQLFDIKEIIT